MRGQPMRDVVAGGVGGRQVVQRARHMRVPLHGLERRQHGQRVDQALRPRIEPHLQGHGRGQTAEVDGEELVEIDGRDVAAVECFQHIGRDQRDAGGPFASEQSGMRGLHCAQEASFSSCLTSEVSASAPAPYRAYRRRRPCVS